MIERFGDDTALLLIDLQQGVNTLQHWGGPTGRRNNPDAEHHQGQLLKSWRDADRLVVYTQHDSREENSPLKFALPTGDMIAGLEPRPGEVVIRKDVNSAFVGTDLELRLREHRIHRLVVAGFFTNFCVETTIRMSGNFGYDTYLVHDACATTNRVGPDGSDHDPDVVHELSVASMHAEFCTAIGHEDAIALLSGDAPHLTRVQGNE